MAKIRGDSVLFQIYTGGNWVTVAGQTGGSLSRSKAEINESSKDTNGLEEVASGFSSWTFSCEGLFDASDSGQVAVRTHWAAETLATVRFYDNTNYHTGSALCTAWNVDAAMDDDARYSLELKGSGELAVT